MIIEEKIGKNQNSNWWADRVKQLIDEQKENWQLFRNNFESLQSLRTREFLFNLPNEHRGFKVNVQFNPNRIKSSAADVSTEAIQSRECFLCIRNLPSEQNGIVYNKNFIILVNPYPIFPEHITISKKKHTPQTIISNFHDLLDLSEDLSKYFTVFYNGPKCGASAPDHMHFQAVTKFSMPIEIEYDFIKEKFISNIFGDDKIDICFFDSSTGVDSSNRFDFSFETENYLRRFITFESKSKGELLYAFKIFLNAFKKISLPKEEPMMNLIATYQNEKWRLFIFPRLNHRPKQYYESGEKKLLISPAAVDLGGTIITVREEDFNKITKEDIVDIYKQVTFTKEYFEYLKKKIGDVYKKKL